jgi:hypothetical protein
MFFSRKGNATNNMCCDLVYTFSLKHSSEILSKVSPQMHTRPHVQWPLFLSNFNETLIFLTDFRNIFKYQIL